MSKPTLEELWHKAEEMTGNEFAVGYSDSSSSYHFQWGNRGAGNMLNGIGERYECEPDEIVESFIEWLNYLENRK